MEVFLSDHGNQEQSYAVQPLLVMIVDEEVIFRQKICELLHGIGGFQVVAEVASGRVALETVKYRQIDLVLADLTLSDGDGISFTAQLKQLAAPPFVVICSRMMHNAALVQAVLAGADGYLLKDTSTRDMIRAFKNLERGGPAMVPAVTTTVLRLLAEQYQAVAMLAPHAQTPDGALAGTLFAPAFYSSYSNGGRAVFGRDPSPRLSPQEAKVFALLRQGQSNKQIAAQLAISPYTVGKHVQNILRKLGAVNRTQAAAYPSFEGGSEGREET